MSKPSSKPADRVELLAALRGILAALTQPKTFPADVELARKIARRALRE